MYKCNLRHAVLLAGFACCAELSLSEPALAVEPHAALRLMQVGNMQYMSGGVSRSERTLLDNRAADFQVRVRFVGKTADERVRSVFVTICERVEGNTVIRLKTAGPVLLMKLPAGRYTLSASTARGAEAVQSQLDLEPGKQQDLEVTLDRPSSTAQAASLQRL